MSLFQCRSVMKIYALLNSSELIVPRLVPPVEHELLTLPEHQSSSRFLLGLVLLDLQFADILLELDLQQLNTLQCILMIQKMVVEQHRQLFSDSRFILLDYHLGWIFSAEDNAIFIALKFIASSDKSKFMICSDSLSCLLAIESCKPHNPFI